MPVFCELHALMNSRSYSVSWNAERNQLVIDLREVCQFAVQGLPTKRHVVGTIGRFYDHLGIMTPVTVQFKIMLRELFQPKLSWDQPLSGRLLTKWKMLLDNLQHGKLLCVLRCYIEEAEKTPKSCHLASGILWCIHSCVCCCHLSTNGYSNRKKHIVCHFKD